MGEAIESMNNDERTEIKSQDVAEAIRKSMMFQEDNETSPLPGNRTLKSFKLKDLLDHADKIAKETSASIVESWIKSEMQKTGLKLKTLCEKEWIQYLNFRKEAVRIMGRDLRQLGM